MTNFRLASVITLCLLLSSCMPVKNPTKDKETEKQTNFIGALTCKDCHEEHYASYAKTIHSKKAVKGPRGQEACETCHGAGELHAEQGGGRGVEIFAFGKDVDAKVKSAQCLTCHEETRQLTNWNMGKHHFAEVSCDACHTLHSQKPKFLKEEQSTLCFRCHMDIRSQSNRQSHHPVKEGLLQCTSCHDPHGAFGGKLIKADTVNELCYKCHAEKRGPFMFEHPPVIENCLNCHTPHGSNHGKLLIRKPPLLCQSCHDADFHSSFSYSADNTFSGTRPQNRMYARACLNCHSNIHGSNASSTLGQRFTR